MQPIPINWGIFKAKFNGREQSSFEWLCYLLFCHEFDQDAGVFRYKNQAGIETNPIEIGEERIGWQAKFYDTRLSEHKRDFIESIDTAQKRHPEITKIIFYTNRDFGQGKEQNDPKYKIRIEDHAENKGIEIEWKTASFFESPFVCEENAAIAQHFFSSEKSVIDFIGRLVDHTKAVLHRTHSTIEFSGNTIKIDRSQVIRDLETTLSESPLVILSGEGGVGKTAVIKDFYEILGDGTPFFLFKATEFNVKNIDQLFGHYGDFTLSDLVKEHRRSNEKYIVIDSAEKLSDVPDTEAFEEFLSTLLLSDWNVIFTTRYSYLTDLEYQLTEVYRSDFQLLNVKELTHNELSEISEEYRFELPTNERLLALLHNPFYLNEYLRYYDNLPSTLNYLNFKKALWDKKIRNSKYKKGNMHVTREKCFLDIVRKRVDGRQFFVKVDDYDPDVLRKLEADEIIEYEQDAGAYFVTHDIYEEWALEKIIQRAFLNSEDHRSFYRDIGSSLPTRRAFREWLSEKLLLKDEAVQTFIETSIDDDSIQSYWKDEILVSVLLSDYSRNFIEMFENRLLENDQELLLRIVFLLRIACKEVDQGSLSRLGISDRHKFPLKHFFTRPKGSGWNCVIDFINEHKDRFAPAHMNAIIPLVHDWNSYNKEGATTGNAGRIALLYYDEITDKGGFDFRRADEIRKKIIQTILNGSFELRDELTRIFDQVVSRSGIRPRSQYYALVQATLSSATDTVEIARNLPEQVIRLAGAFWFKPPRNRDRHFDGGIDIEKHFCLSEHNFRYSPASALQTPILNLLRFAPRETVDFILSLTNKSVECYSKSQLDAMVEEIEIFVDRQNPVRQYISERLWKMYRGTHVSPYLLQSIHMALEKWLLQIAESTSKDVLESWCLYLIKNSRSASITSVITSVVLAYPDKLFDVAKVLFQTRELFSYDLNRYLADESVRDLYSIGYGLNYRDRLYQDERIETCDDPHRKHHLEHLALRYQSSRNDTVTDEEVENRQRVLWDIFDKYYRQLPDQSVQTESDKAWRLSLARMDRRKMRTITEAKEGKVLVRFKPQIEPALTEYSEESLQQVSDGIKHLPLWEWAISRFDKNETKYKKYEEYENNPQFVISEIKEIIAKLQNDKDDDSPLFARIALAYACSVLVRDFSEELSEEDAELCASIITEFASGPLQLDRYSYQVGDGVEPSIVTLPHLIKLLPQYEEASKSLLFLLLFNPWRQTLASVITGIANYLWDISFEDAHSLFLGYLLLKSKYDDLKDAIRRKNYEKGIHRYPAAHVLERFVEEHETIIERVISNAISYDELDDLDEMDLEVLITAFELLPLGTENNDHNRFLSVAFPLFAKELFSHDEEIDYQVKLRFFKKFAAFILTSGKEEIEEYLQPFVESHVN